MALKQGWQGRIYENFEVGDIYQHPIGRTITQTDNIWFTLHRPSSSGPSWSIGGVTFRSTVVRCRRHEVNLI
jgi:hypothetical protein